MQREIKYRPGLQFYRCGKERKLTTVLDVWVTKNLIGEIVKVEYVCEHNFLGQTVTSYLPQTSIDRGERIIDEF